MPLKKNCAFFNALVYTKTKLKSIKTIYQWTHLFMEFSKCFLFMYDAEEIKVNCKLKEPSTWESTELASSW